MKPVPDHFLLANRIVRVEWPDDGLQAVLGAALAHRKVPAASAALQITAATRADWPAATEAGRVELGGQVAITVLDPARRVALELNEAGTAAEFSCFNPAGLPAYERAAPFRLLLQRWLRAQAVHMLHAGAVGLPAKGAVLLVARSGGGKSNTVLSCLGSPLRLLGEDFVAVDDSDAPRIWSLYSAAKLHAKDLPRFPALAADVAGIRDELDGKSVLQLGARHGDRFADGLPLRAILVLDVTGRAESRVAPALAGDAAKAMLASILMALPESRRPLFEFVTQLVRRVPVQRLEVGTDPRAIPGVILKLLEDFRA